MPPSVDDVFASWAREGSGSVGSQRSTNQHYAIFIVVKWHHNLHLSAQELELFCELILSGDLPVSKYALLLSRTERSVRSSLRSMRARGLVNVTGSVRADGGTGINHYDLSPLLHTCVNLEDING